MPRRRGSGRKMTLAQRSRKVDPAVKAVAHNLTGAGRSKVKRPFFELNEQDVTMIVKELNSRLRARL